MTIKEQRMTPIYLVCERVDLGYHVVAARYTEVAAGGGIR